PYTTLFRARRPPEVCGEGPQDVRGGARVETATDGLAQAQAGGPLERGGAQVAAGAESAEGGAVVETEEAMGDELDDELAIVVGQVQVEGIRTTSPAIAWWWARTEG